MVLDEDIVEAVITGNTDAVKAWVAADQSRVNDFATFPGSDMKFTLLSIAVTGRRDEAKLSLPASGRAADAGRRTVACRTSKFSASGRSSRAAARFLSGRDAGDRAAATGGRTASLRSCASSATTESCGRSSNSGKRRGE